MNLNDFNEVEGELMQMGYDSLEIASIWKDKKTLREIISRIEDARSLTLEELEQRLGEVK